ncbi:MAG: alanine--tRNA ligase [Candidatus Dadabacteria bacterium]|nr:MAG: alanine--tRNA ligase [Candidatus Dadabacteria bacterium]
MTFLIADGVLPDHEGRGYVLRRIMRRAIRYGRKAGAKGPFLAAVCDAVIDEMSPIYAELAEHRDVIERVVGLEEERFGETLDRGLALFAEAAEAARAAGNDTIPGEVVFRLYDTFGFPVDLTALLAREEGLQIDQAGFDECMQQQRERARAARKDTSTGDTSFSELPKTRFTGYDLLEDRGHVIAVEPRGEDSYAIVLDKTPFYAESGGQVADRGTLRWGDHHLTVEDVQKQGDVYVHLARGEQAPPSEAEVQAVVDPWWRTHTMAHHTSTHLLQAALREVLGTHVRQSGSLVEPKRLRFDFSHFAALAPEEQQAIEDIVNEKIRADLAVQTREMPYDEAVASGAMAFFGDKYGATVRVVDIGGWSIELCGGTHVRRTGEIGVFVIDSEASVSAGVRRVEAVTADIALERVRGLEQQLNTIAERLGVPRRDLIRRIDHLLEQVDATERELQRLRQKAAGNLADQLADHLEKIGDIELVAGCVPDGDINALRTLTDQVRNAAPDAIVFLISKAERPALFLSAPDQLAERLPAGQLLREAAAAMGARGGGKATSAQGGGGDPERADAAIEALRTAIQSRI